MPQTFLEYGESGTYKTTQCGVFADYQAARCRAIRKREDCYVRHITADSGIGPISDQVSRGTSVPLLLSAVEKPLPFLTALSKGYWPQRVSSEGIADESSLAMTKDWGEVAGYAIEGLKMIAHLLQQYLVSQQRNTGEPLVAVFTETLPGVDPIRYAHASRGTYGFVQEQMFAALKAFKTLLVPRVLWTGHEGKGEDDQGLRIFGPAMIGKAANNKTSEQFENTFHHQSILINGKPTNAMYFIRHLDPDVPNVYWPAKLGLEPRLAAKVRKKWANGYIPLVMDEEGEYRSGIHTFLSLIDEGV